MIWEGGGFTGTISVAGRKNQYDSRIMISSSLLHGSKEKLTDLEDALCILGHGPDKISVPSKVAKLQWYKFI